MLQLTCMLRSAVRCVLQCLMLWPADGSGQGSKRSHKQLSAMVQAVDPGAGWPGAGPEDGSAGGSSKRTRTSGLFSGGTTTAASLGGRTGSLHTHLSGAMRQVNLHGGQGAIAGNSSHSRRRSVRHLRCLA